MSTIPTNCFTTMIEFAFSVKLKTKLNIHSFSNIDEDKKHPATNLILNGCKNSSERVDYVLSLENFVSLKRKNMQYKEGKQRITKLHLKYITLLHENCMDKFKIFVVHF